MYLKLTMRCALRSIKQYSIFMFTITMVMTLLYAFQSLMFSEQIIRLFGAHVDMLYAFLMVSILLVIVMTWLIGYISGFIIKNRSREFGIYLLSGIERKVIARMLVVEMFFMGFLSFIIGCFLGSFLSEVLRMLILQFFSKDFQFVFHFSIETMGSTFLYFLFMWILTLWKERRTIMKVNIKELLYEENKNDPVVKHRFIKWMVLLIACICFFFGIIATKKGILDMLYGEGSPVLLIGVILLVISNYGFYYGMIALSDAFVNRQKKIKYSFGILPLYGHIKGRINGNRMELATLSMLLIFTIMLSSFALKLYDSSNVQMDIICPYELQINATEPFKSDEIKIMLEKKGYQIQDDIFCLYSCADAKTNVDMIFTQDQAIYGTSFMKESDYQKLLKLKHKTAASIPSHGYILLVNEFDKKRAEEKGIQLSIKDEKMVPFQIRNDSIGQLYDDVVFVVKDEVLKDSQMLTCSYVADSDKPFPIGMEKEITKSIKLPLYASINVRSDTQQASISSSVTIIFALFYLSFVFICIAATIMATQQMMDATRQKYEYELMHQLGMDKAEIYAILRKQIGIYFFVPMILPVVYIFPLLYIVNLLFLRIPGNYSIYTVAFGCMLLYMVIYLCYYMMAYIGCKRSLDLK